MATILHIETATKNCSVSVADKGELLAIQELNDGNYSHAEKLHPFIQQVMQEAKLSFNDIDAVAVSKGPGSYTGLRIGVSAAKGLCFAFDKPLISIETLQSLAYKLSIEQGVIIPMLDARRMEVYAAVYNSKHEQVRDIKAEVIDENSFQEYLSKGKVYFLGDGAEKCKEVITHENAVFIDGEFPSAKEMVKLSFDKYKKNDIEDVAYFEPFYLKDFVVTPEKKR
ncbi:MULTISPECIES: tRNA (adenosine(37)-N6)-threonylcarbamoyltransferase complex dimerization subunit type 1 TsaB [Tenacibaculum]|uniref:tRNA (Adenosine(37)-N6)-threonylcarbamoyltransferase complex dimerization subunit type 1 TsaB n=1 Tax=Tenacibaculum discolor TaxID=361581 RepID=A0A2G1BW18_9FLAO|nr:MULTISPECIES: tRNA (adenosine(37)-N6)-threonylcarbamoyltransferase complex dimerization subunit type 1 TsaB [Tenacibaculum]MDP2540275.1 tRNA (adenosine(37)-N6)-threonylcarbamoyltransferase complex dimerization subunit type 1 TsaB [Tenacibaculum discolor]NVK09141.1 tRNA (adenosine(37)-N6)-threonylcarbamoyltransferase complex dimerization subunit type 1 TsaB [Tenacibaculum sp.]PHN98220.1 tRNA (adenosine(37)-N6)-threonylcarbamoyltransferase complex dimerization subunit type 1 TsaB [Tenacibaculum